MPKAKIYGYDELIKMKKADLKKVLTQQIERYNKQITRIQSSGLEYEKVLDTFSEGGKEKIVRPKKVKAKATRKEMIRQYFENKKRYGVEGVTKTTVKKQLKEKKEAEKEFFSGRELSKKEWKQFKQLTERASSMSNLFYAFMRKAETAGLMSMDEMRNDPELANFSPNNERFKEIMEKLDSMEKQGRGEREKKTGAQYMMDLYQGNLEQAMFEYGDTAFKDISDLKI